MSDRYDDARWQVEPQETEVEDPDEGLDAARENVLEDWPASQLLAPAEGKPASPPSRRRLSSTASPSRPTSPTPPPPDGEPFAAQLVEPDPVAPLGRACPGILAVPPGYAVLEGVPEGRRRTVGIVVAVQQGGDDAPAPECPR